jgi:putative aminopeptidase FrvX
MINVALLKEICEVPGVPGHEQKVRELITRELTGIADSISVDNMGNLVALKKGKSSEKKSDGRCTHG